MKLFKSKFCCGAPRLPYGYRPTEQAATEEAHAAELTAAEAAHAAEQAAAEAAHAAEQAAAEAAHADELAAAEAAHAAEQAAAEVAKREKAHDFRRKNVFDRPVYLLNILRHCSAKEAVPFLHYKSVEYIKVLFNAAGNDIRLKEIIFSNLNSGKQIKLLQILINSNPQFKTTNNLLYNQLIGKIELGEAKAAEKLKEAEDTRYKAIKDSGLVGHYNGKIPEIETPYKQALKVYKMELAKSESKRRVIEFLLCFGFTNFTFYDFKLVHESCKKNPCEKMKTKGVCIGDNHPVILPQVMRYLSRQI